LAKQVLIFWGIKKANFCLKVLKSLGSYTRVFTVILEPNSNVKKVVKLLHGLVNGRNQLIG